MHRETGSRLAADVPAQQVEPPIPWLMMTTGAKKLYLPSAVHCLLISSPQ
jgi:hypothetical protein